MKLAKRRFLYFFASGYSYWCRWGIAPYWLGKRPNVRRRK